MDLSREDQITLASAAIALALLWRLLGKALDQYFSKRYVFSYDIPLAAIERPEEKRIKGTAIICGGSIAGLFSARICASHFEEVIVIEAEEWTNTPAARAANYDKNGEIIDSAGFYKRKRIEQYESGHAFLPIVLHICKTLFPSFEQDIMNADGRIRKGALNPQFRDGRLFRDATNFPLIFTSRDLFERTLRKEVMTCTRIRQITGTVTGIRHSPHDLCRLQGVTARLGDGEETFLPATLVVDCTGQTQAGYKWLKRMFENVDAKPQIAKSIPYPDLRIEYHCNIILRKWCVPVAPEMRGRLPIPGGYDACGWVYGFLPRAGKDNKSFTITRIEGHRFELNCGVRAQVGEPPLIPATPNEILAHVKNISDDYEVFDWVLKLVHILLEVFDQWVDNGTDNLVSFSNVRYEKAPFLPHNFVAIGDSYARVNPTYGQGVAKAGAAALILDNLLRSENAQSSIANAFGRRFADVHDRKLSSIWTSNRNIDYQWSSTTPVKGEDRSVAGNGEFGNLLMQLALKDDTVDSLLATVRSLIRPPTDLLQPKILIKIALFKVQQKLGYAVFFYGFHGVDIQ